MEEIITFDKTCVKFVNFHILRIWYPCVSWWSLWNGSRSAFLPQRFPLHCLALPILRSPTRSLPLTPNPPTISLRFPNARRLQHWLLFRLSFFLPSFRVFSTDVPNPEIPKPATPITDWKVSSFPFHASYRSLPSAFYSSPILLCSTLVPSLKLWSTFLVMTISFSSLSLSFFKNYIIVFLSCFSFFYYTHTHTHTHTKLRELV